MELCRFGQNLVIYPLREKTTFSTPGYNNLLHTRFGKKRKESSNQTYFSNYSDEGKELESIFIQNWNLQVTVAKKTYPI